MLYITPPTLTKSINNLERELGVPLFYKKNNNLYLTTYGKVFHSHIKNVLKEVSDCLNVIEFLSGNNSGEIRIGSIFTIASDFLPNEIKQFTNRYPNVKFSMCQQTTRQNLIDLYEDELDLVFVSDYKPFEEALFPNSFNCECIMNEEIMVAVPSSHRLAKNESISFQDISKETFVSYNMKTGINAAIEEAIRAAGYEPTFSISYTANEENAIIGLVRAGLGLAFICNAPNVNRDDVVLFSLSDIFIYRPIYLVWKKNVYMPPIVTNFKNFIVSNSNLSINSKKSFKKVRR